MVTEATTSDIQAQQVGGSISDLMGGAVGTIDSAPAIPIDHDESDLEAAQREARAAEDMLNARLMELEALKNSPGIDSDELGKIDTDIEDLRGQKGAVIASLASGNASGIRATSQAAANRAGAVKARLAEQNREMMMAAILVGGAIAMSSEEILANSSAWQSSALDKLKKSGDYISTHEEFGFSDTESIFNNTIEDIDKRIAAASGPDKQALMDYRQQVIDLQVKTNEAHTVEALNAIKADNPEVAAGLDGKLAGIDRVAMQHNEKTGVTAHDQAFEDMPEGANKQALRIVKVNELIELEERVRNGETLNEAQRKKLEAGQGLLNGLSADEKHKIQEASDDLAAKRAEYSTRDKGTIAEQMSALSKKAEQEVGRANGGHGQEQEVQHAQAPAHDPIAQLFGAEMASAITALGAIARGGYPPAEQGQQTSNAALFAELLGTQQRGAAPVREVAGGRSNG